MTDTAIVTSDLTPKQHQAISAMLVSKTMLEAAEMANVSPKTLYRWLEDSTFKLALLDAEGEIIDAVTRRLISLSDTAIDTVETILKDEKATANLKLRAAQTVLDYLLKLRELRNLEDRLTAIESLVYDRGR
jgi:AcrR family transcriptional regulator